MILMQKLRQIGLVALVLVAGSVAAYADATLFTFGDTTATVDVTGTATGNTQTEIKATQIQVHILGGSANVPLTTAYMTFDITSTTSAVDPSIVYPLISQRGWAGTFSITQNADGSGTNYLTGNVGSSTGSGAGLVVGGSINTTAGDQSMTLNGNKNANNVWTGTTKAGFTGPFGYSFTFGNIAAGVGLTNTGGVPTTIASFTSNVQGSFTAASYSSVPEPSTLSLLGLGAAGLAFGAYRRRKAAAAV